MGILSRIYDPRPAASSGRAPYDPFWYTDPSSMTDTGITVTPELSLRYSVVWACVRLISQQVAGLPLMTFERTDDGKKPAPQNPLYDLLHDKPNSWQTSYQFREMMTIHVLLRGNAYAVKLRKGNRGATEELVPLHPDLMEVERLKNGSLRYIYKPTDGDEMRFLQDEMFHLCGPSVDGITGMSVISLAAQGVGLALAMESYGALFFKQNATPRIVLEMEGRTDSDDIDNAVLKNWHETVGGLAGAHKAALLKQGMKAHVIGVSNEDSQFLESRNHQVADIARWFLVKPHKVNELSRATFNNIEHQSIEHLTDTLDPWLIRWETTCNRDLVLQPRRFFCEFVREGLLQADIKSKNEAFAIAIQNGWMNRNEVRQRLNLNTVDGLDDYLVPMNMTTQEQAEELAKQPPAPPPAPEPPPQENGRAREIVSTTVDRIQKREIQAVTKWATRHASDPAAWAKWVESFYEDHTRYLCDALRLPPGDVRGYCDSHADELLADGVGAAEKWPEQKGELIDLALGEGS